MSKAICDHHMTNSWSTIWPIHHLTIIWPTHFRSMHMTNDMANISISTNLIICGGSNIKCKWFISCVVYLYCPSPVNPPNNNSQPHYPFRMEFGPAVDCWAQIHSSPPPPTNTFQRASSYWCLPPGILIGLFRVVLIDESVSSVGRTPRVAFAWLQLAHD